MWNWSSLDDLFSRADYVSLHMPSNDTDASHWSTPNDWRKRSKGIRIVNTARGDLIDEAALADAIESGQVAGAALDVFEKEPTVDHRLQMLPQVIATPHIAASTREGQELVGVETAAALRDFLKDGVIRNAVNFPSVSPEEFKRLQPFAVLGERLGTFVAQMNDERISEVSLRYYGELAQSRTGVIVNAVLAGLFKPIALDWRHRGQRPNSRGRARDRDRGVTQHAPAKLHEPHLAQSSHRARRTLGRRRRVREDVAASRDG